MEYEKILGRPLTADDIRGLEENKKFSQEFYKGISEDVVARKEEEELARQDIVKATAEKRAAEQSAYEITKEEVKRKAAIDAEESYTAMVASAKAIEKKMYENVKEGRDLESLFLKKKEKALSLIKESISAHNEWDSKRVGSIHPDRKKWEESEPTTITKSHFNLDTWDIKKEFAHLVQ